MDRITRLVAEGEICCICNQPFHEPYDAPKACEECGGDGVVHKEAEE